MLCEGAQRLLAGRRKSLLRQALSGGAGRRMTLEFSQTHCGRAFKGRGHRPVDFTPGIRTDELEAIATSSPSRLRMGPPEAPPSISRSASMKIPGSFSSTARPCLEPNGHLH